MAWKGHAHVPTLSYPYSMHESYYRVNNSRLIIENCMHANVMTNAMTEDIPGPDTYESNFRTNGRLRLICLPTDSPGPRACVFFLSILDETVNRTLLWPRA